MFRCFNQSTGELEITISKSDVSILLDFARIAPCDTDTTVLMCNLFHDIYNDMNDKDVDSIKFSSGV